MILMKLTWPLLRMLLRYIRRQIVTRILDYCWPEKEIQSVRCALVILFRILLRLLRERLIKRNTAATFRPDNTSC